MKSRMSRIDPDAEVSLALSEAERKLIKEETFIEDELRMLLRARKVEDKLQPVKMALDDWEELQGHVAASANHAGDKQTKNDLDKIWGKIQRQVFDKYDDQG